MLIIIIKKTKNNNYNYENLGIEWNVGGVET